MKTLTGLQATKHILDPIHGPIPLTKVEIDIISTPVFQRLRGITQLSMASLVFPGATHNRFQHCIGTVHVIDKLLYTLKLENKLNSNNEVSNRIIQKMRIAALLHDSGHLPFSHTFENLYKESNIHEIFGRCIIERSEIKDILENNKLEPKTIGGLIIGQVFVKDPDAVILRDLLPLLDSDADADRMDYLLRDGYFTGVPYGRIDLSRITNFITLEEGKICYHEKAQSALEDFLFSRYQMYKIVYIHKTIIGYDLLLHKLYQEYIKVYHNKLGLPFNLPTLEEFKNSEKKWYDNELFKLTEASFFSSIQTLLVSKKLDDKIQEDLKNLYSRIIERKPIKNCFHYNELAEIYKTEFCENEVKLYEELQKNHSELIDHWSFLRHDPSNPIRIATPISKDTEEDSQASEQIRIINSTGEISLLQDKRDSIINNLVGHHWVLICYYHEIEKDQKIIEKLANEYLPINILKNNNKVEVSTPK